MMNRYLLGVSLSSSFLMSSYYSDKPTTADFPDTNSKLPVLMKPYAIKTVEIQFAAAPAVAESAQQ